MKKAISLLLALGLAFSLACPALAGTTSESRADALHSLGLFQGTDAGYELLSGASRVQGLVMLIRLLGEEDAALSHTGANPFSDVPQWAAPYAAYAYSKGYVEGTGPGLYAPDSPLDAKSYVTLVLRALGYREAEGDFSWASAPADSARLGLMSAASASAVDAASPFLRGDMADVSYCALTMPLKNSTQTLAEKLVSSGVFSYSAGYAAGVMDGRVAYEYGGAKAPDAPVTASGVTKEYKTLALPSGVSLSATVITVDLSNPNVRVEAALADDTLGVDKPFRELVADAGGAKAVIDSNFIQRWEEEIFPVGHVMVNGKFLFGVSGITAFGFTEDGKVRVGAPRLFFRLSAPSGKSWAMYELNSFDQSYYNSVLYTPNYRGGVLPISGEGTVAVVSGGRFTEYRAVSAGETLSVPADGYVLWMGGQYTSTPYFRAPVVGESVYPGYEPYFHTRDGAEDFALDGLCCVVSGAPRLVRDGAMVTELEPGFTGERFTVNHASRTAMGALSDSKIVLVNVASATIQQLRELMLALGCVDAINLDGGGSTAMYYDGQMLCAPGRELACTLRVYED